MSNGNGKKENAAITKNAVGDQSIAPTGEMSTATGAARATAIVQARITQAMVRPRMFDVVRERLMAECDRPRFAMSARYSRPQGWVLDEHNRPVLDANGEKIRNYITGWSIRFVEAAISALGNITPVTTEVFDDDRKKVLYCEVWDYERNVSWAQEVTLEKTVERKFLKANQKPIGSRENSYGDTVYLLPATADEVRLAENRLISMTTRTLGLRLIPSDLLEEALDRVMAAREKAVEAERAGIVADPGKARKDFLDKMARIGVKAADIAEYLGGRALDSATPDMILELRAVGAGIVSGDITWRDALAGSPYREQTEAPEDDKAKEARDKIQAMIEKGKKGKATASAETLPKDNP